jgi:trk system potassium uptake protein TrkA
MSAATQHERVLHLARRPQGVTAREIAAAGIHRQALTRLVEAGQLERVVRGLYRLPERPFTEHHGLVLASAAVPQGAICLLSALQFHGIGTQLPADVLVLNGDSTDEDLMGDENVRDMDLFIALTSDDEDNIMACLLAKRLGARRVLALINRKAYADLVQSTQIDIALSPSHAVIGELLAYVRRGDVESVHSLRRGAAEALEAVVRGDAASCRIAGRRVEQLDLPRGAQIGAIVRGLPGSDDPRADDAAAIASAEVIIPHHDTLIRTGDRVIVFIPRKRMVKSVEKLFQVSATFFG